MQTARELERDDFGRRITWALRSGIGNTQPSDQVWQRIVQRVGESSGSGRTSPRRGRRGGRFGR